MSGQFSEFFDGVRKKLEPRPEDEQNLQESGLTPVQLKHLRLEAHGIQHPGLKESAVRDNFDLSMVRHAQAIYYLVNTPEAYSHNNGEFAPMLHRISRIMEQTMQRRSGRRYADER